jgi:hypothetical protein
MELCAEKTFEESWDCMLESNGELLPIIIFAECMWWLFILIMMRLGVQGIRTRWRKRKRMKRMKVELDNNWAFPPKRKN